MNDDTDDEVDPVNGVDGCMSGRAMVDMADVAPICCGSISVRRDGSALLVKHVTDPTCTHRCCRPPRFLEDG
jgi:hypothetical protein